MEPESFDNWKLCWDINTLFHLGTYSSAIYNCLWCKKTKVAETVGSSWSKFLPLASSCSAKHTHENSGEVWKQPGVCPECEIDLVQKIAERRQRCNVGGCRAFMIVDEDVVRKTIGENDGTER